MDKNDEWLKDATGQRIVTSRIHKIFKIFLQWLEHYSELDECFFNWDIHGPSNSRLLHFDLFNKTTT